MSTKDSELLEQQRQRRKRINRMKTTLVMSIAIWMLVSFLAIIILVVQVVKLNSRIYKLELQQQQTVGKSLDSSPLDTEKEPESEEVDDTDSNVVTGIDTVDNMAAEGDEHRVYLTFDSVPSENTGAILDALAESNIKATFFVSGDSTEESREIYKRIVEEGHTLGMHSYSNQYSLIYDSVEAFEADYNKISGLLNEVTGTSSMFYRFPGGSGNEISNVSMTEFVRVLNGKGITYFDWNVSAGDTSSDYTEDDVVNNVVEGVEKYKTSVVLLHDDKSKIVTAQAIKQLVESLNEMNAEILPIDESTYVVQYIKANSVE